RLDGPRQPRRAAAGCVGFLVVEERGEIARAEVLDEVTARLVVRDEERDADPSLQRDAGGRPPPTRVGLFRRVDDAEHRTAVGQPKANVPSAADVARQDLESDGL